MSRLTAVFGCVSDTMTVSPNRTMLPPIWVAACDSQRRRNPAFRKTLSAPSGTPGASGSSRPSTVVEGSVGPVTRRVRLCPRVASTRH